MTVLLEENLHQDWRHILLYAKRFADYYYFVFSPMGEAQPPSTPPALGPLDSAMLEELEYSLPAMNLEVATSAASARNAPPPAPPTPDSKKFWRIHANWSVDTDGDGSLDWEEFEIAANPSHPSHGLGNAFNADADGNGVADGDQADTDSDGIPNSQDADRGNNVIDWQRADDVRFAWFEIPPPEAPWGGNQSPIQITDRGHVVFPWGLWSSGAYGNLALSGDRTDNCTILGMSGSTVLGVGAYDNNDDGHTELACMVRWQDGSPAPITMGNSFAYYPFPFHPSNGQYLGDDLGFVAHVYSQGILGTEPVRWKLSPPGTAGDVTMEETDQWVQFGVSSAVLWGGNQAKIGGVTSTMPGYYDRLVVTPGNSVIGFSTSGSRPALYRNGSWTIEETFKDLVDFSNKGFGVSASPVTIWNNGKVSSLAAAAPGLPQDWQQKSRFLDLSNAGNLLVERRNSPSESPDAFGFAMPISLEDDEEATGVDVTSITSTQPGPGIDNKLWIMAPAGGTNDVNFKSTADVNYSQPSLAAPPATFTPNFLASTDETVEVGATAGSNTADLDLNIFTGLTPSLSSPVGIKVTKKRTLRVSVFKVAKDIGSGLSNPPDLVPSEAAMNEYLNGIFGRQLNLEITAKIFPVAIVVPWDADGNRSLDIGAVDQHSGEQDLILDELPGDDSNPHVQVFLMGGGVPFDDSDYGGATNRAQRTCWVLADPVTGQSTIPEMLHTAAHEIGHVIVGYGHPDKKHATWNNPAPLPGTHWPRRLMVSAKGGGLNPGTLLVKGEWDAAEAWMKPNIDPN